MKTLLNIVGCIIAFLLCSIAFGATEAEKLLQARQAEFEKDIVEVAAGVYTAVGYGVSTTSMIVGDSGVVIIDAQIDQLAAQAVLAEFQKISDKPVEAIIFTHGHGDHTGGASVFAAAGDSVEIFAREGYNQESLTLQDAGLKIQGLRGARQGGFMLEREQRINNGVAQAYWPNRGGEVFGAGTDPTHLVDESRKIVRVAGVELELVAASGETYDQLYVWFPKKRLIFSGDNFYKSWPNLYAIRGTPYRDVLAWTQSLTAMINEEPHYLVGGHTRPILGREKVLRVLTNYRGAIKSIFEQTIAGMNKGLTPDELVEIVELPQQYAELDYLKEYYGNIEWAVRSIFAGYLGWFDGNPSNLFPLSPKEEADRVARLAGGADALLSEARSALKDQPQWTAQLCDYLVSLDHETREAKLLKASALERIAENLLTATGRNYYLTVAKELRQSVEAKLR